jgi:hypothetical protein
MSRAVRFVDSAAQKLAGKSSRRGFLGHAAVVGSALAVAPLRYLLHPQSAYAAIVRPWQCGSGLCADGFTEFCCAINDGKNACPPNSYVAGWWKCTDYRGNSLCGDLGFRYYVDCNRVPGQQMTGGCQCANGDCGNRRTNCVMFRYGQCNTQVPVVTEVVCRVVICDHPASVAEFRCNSTYKEDNRTCTHDAPCLAHAGAAERFTW